jgi:hypothetical protein
MFKTAYFCLFQQVLAKSFLKHATALGLTYHPIVCEGICKFSAKKMFVCSMKKIKQVAVIW